MVSRGRGGRRLVGVGASLVVLLTSFGTAPAAFAAGHLGPPAFFGAPGLTSGQVTGRAKVPVYVEWFAPSDVGSGIASYEFERATGNCTSYSALASFPAGTSSATFLLSTSASGTDCLRARSVDTEGQHSDWAYKTVGKLQMYQESRTEAGQNGTRILYDGTWTRKSVSGASGGAVMASNDSTAEATVEFYGTSVALEIDKMPGHGSFYLDFDTNPVDANPGSVPIDPFNTNSATKETRTIIWSRNNFAPGLHFLHIRPAGNGRIDFDAFINIR
jgi:hypothetical protein